jgi:hypothetical protein
MLNLLKLSIAYTRWGKLTIEDMELICKSPFGKVMGACYIRSTRLSLWSCNTLE